MTKTSLVRPGNLERALRLARLAAGALAPIIVVLDADDDCPAQLGPDLKARATKPGIGHEVSIIIPKQEFENWFLAAAESLAGKRGMRENLRPPEYPEQIKGAKEWLRDNMIPGRSYSPAVDQASLAAAMDLEMARRCPSFTRLVRDVSNFVQRR